MSPSSSSVSHTRLPPLSPQPVARVALRLYELRWLSLLLLFLGSLRLLLSFSVFLVLRLHRVVHLLLRSLQLLLLRRPAVTPPHFRLSRRRLPAGWLLAAGDGAMRTPAPFALVRSGTLAGFPAARVRMIPGPTQLQSLRVPVVAPICMLGIVALALPFSRAGRSSGPVLGRLGRRLAGPTSRHSSPRFRWRPRSSSLWRVRGLRGRRWPARQ